MCITRVNLLSKRLYMFLLYFCVLSASLGRAGLYNENSSLCLYYSRVYDPLNRFVNFDYEIFKAIGEKAISFSDMIFGTGVKDVGVNFMYREVIKVPSDFANLTISEPNKRQLSEAITNKLNYEFYIDELRCVCPIGMMVDNVPMMYTQFYISAFYNNLSIIEVRVRGGKLATLALGTRLTFSYTVAWEETVVTVEKRIESSLDKAFFKHDSRNTSLVMMCAAVLFVWLLVHKIYYIMTKDSDEGRDGVSIDPSSDDQTWKLVHGDLFRAPKNLGFLAVATGSGAHVLATLVLCVSFRGIGFLTVFLIVAGSSAVAGIVSSFVLSWFDNKEHRLAYFTSSVAFPGLSIIIEAVISFASMSADWSHHVVFKGYLWILLAVVIMAPVNIFAGVLSSTEFSRSKKPHDVSAVPRQEPKLPFYLQTWFSACWVGLLIASMSCTELYYILTALFKDKSYIGYWRLLAAILGIVVLSGGFSIIIVYMRLQKECYHWHWASFIAPALTGIFSLVYCCVYYCISKTSNFIVFFLISVMISAAIALVCGSSGLILTNGFIQTAMKYVKLE